LIADRLRDAGLEGVRNTDDHPVLEHRYPRALFERPADAGAELERQRHRGTGNDVLPYLWSLRAEPNGLVLPPGFDARQARPQVVLEVCSLSGLDPLPQLCGLPSFEAVEQRGASLPRLQQELAFLHAVRSGARDAAERLWPLLAGAPLAEPELAHAALLHAERSGDRARVEAVIGKLGLSRSALAPAALQILLDHDIAAMARGEREIAPSRYVWTLLEGVPPARILEVFLPHPCFSNVAAAAAMCGRTAEVEAWLRATQAHLRDLPHLGLDLGLRNLCRGQGRLDEAKAIEARYDRWESARAIFAGTYDAR
jgi:hypothetical protein